MKNYNKPTIEVLDINLVDVIAASFNDAPQAGDQTVSWNDFWLKI